MVYAGQVINCLAEPMKAYDRILTMCGYRTDFGSYILNFGAFGIIALAVMEAIGLNLVNAPYGRYASRKYGPMIPAKLAWMLSQLPSVVIPILVFLTSEHSAANVANYLLLGMFLLHYTIKSFVHPLIIRGENPMPVVPFVLATLYCAVNGYIQSKFLLCYADYGFSWVLGLRFIVGSMLMLIGMGINLHGDATLAMLRRPDVVSKRDEGFPADAAGGQGLVAEEETRIPHGGLFEYVSCANFLGEIIEWFGWALAAWSLPALAHFLFTCGNLIPRAKQHHLDYINKFKDAYPRNRFAVVPGVL